MVNELESDGRADAMRAGGGVVTDEAFNSPTCQEYEGHGSDDEEDKKGATERVDEPDYISPNSTSPPRGDEIGRSQYHTSLQE